jgi:hypothetical protein
MTRLVSSAAHTGLACIAAASTAMAQRITLEPPVPVSPPGVGGHFFGFGNTKADPGDAAHVVTCGIRQRARPASWQGYLYETRDAGRSWYVAKIDSSRAQDSSDALVSEVSCAIGPRSRVYMVAETWNPRERRHDLGAGVFRLYHSDDHGATWSVPLTRRWLDHSRSVVDASGRLFIFGNGPALDTTLRVDPDTISALSPAMARKIYSTKPVAISDDGGRTLRPDAFGPKDTRYIGNYPTEAAVLRDGTVLGLYGSGRRKEPGTSPIGMPSSKRERVVEVVRVTSGGKQISAPVTIYQSDEIAGYEASLAVDGSSGRFANRAYAAWMSGTGAHGHVEVSHSDDGGRTWSAPLIVDDTAPDSALRGDDHTDPSLAVTSNGTVGIMWAEQQHRCWRFAASLDGAATFSPSTAVNLCRPRPPSGTDAFNGHLISGTLPMSRTGNDTTKLGFFIRMDDWAGVSGLTATADNALLATWSTRESAGELWSSRIHVNEPMPAPVTLAGLRRLSSSHAPITVAMSNLSWDGESGRLLCEVSLINRDTVAYRGPVAVQFDSLWTDGKMVHLLDGGGASSSPHTPAIVDLTDDVPGGVLAPGARTRPHRLVFSIDGVTSDAWTRAHADATYFLVSGTVSVLVAK